MTHRRWLITFFSTLLAVVVLLVLGTFFAIRIVRAPDYAASVPDASVVVQEKPFLMHNQPCDVLVGGDSTALNGIDPRVITSETGLTACNIASVRPIWDGLGTLPIDAFLANNPKPKVLVLQFGPELFYRATSWEHIPNYAPYVLLIRRGSPAAAARLILSHPTQTVQFLQLVYKLRFGPRAPAERARSRAVFDRTIAGYNESGGRLNLELPALTQCVSPPLELFGPLDPKWITDLRHRYEALGIVTLIDSSPVPTCDPQLDKFSRELKPYVDADTVGLPVGLFVAGDRHMTADGARYQAGVIADQVKAALAARVR